MQDTISGQKKSERNSANPVKEYMVTALMQLLETKPMSEITVTDITDKAGVSRMSYYRNYSSKEAILIDHLDEIFKNYIALVREWNYGGSCFEYDFLLQCFRYFNRHQEFLACLLKSGMGGLLLSHQTKFIIDFFCPDREDTLLFYKMQALSGSIFSTYIAWLDRKNRESPEEMARIVCAIYADSALAAT